MIDSFSSLYAAANDGVHQASPLPIDHIYRTTHANMRTRLASSVPGYSLEKIGKGVYQMSIPVPGVSQDHITLTAQLGRLDVKVHPQQAGGNFMYQDFQPASWHHTFYLEAGYMPHVAFMKQGILYVEIFLDTDNLNDAWTGMPYQTAQTDVRMPIRTLANTH